MTENMSIQRLNALLQSQGIGPAGEVGRPAPSSSGSAGVEGESAPSFAEALKESIREVNDLKAAADSAVEELATGHSGDVQGTILAVEKADVSFKMMMEVRNKLLSAYQEIMRTQV